MKLRFLFSLLVNTCFLFTSSGHVGSPGVVFEGNAGPYSLMVNINPPDVIPGVADISIYTIDPSIESIQVKPIYWGYGDEGSPKSDPMNPVADMPGQYEGVVWLMSSGTASIAIYVEGEKGTGEVVIPIMASATATRDMDANLGMVLAGLGMFLVILMVTIISAANGQSVDTPGKIENSLRRRKIIGGSVGLLLIGLVLYGGKVWWDAESNAYQRYMYKAPTATSWVESQNGERVLNFQIDAASVRKRNRLSMKYLVPDHGKLMHLFIIKDESLDVFAHLHPKRVDSLRFKVQLPEVPAGRYVVFGDIVRLNGYVETISDTLEIPGNMAINLPDSTSQWSDPDNTYIVATADIEKDQYDFGSDILICGKPGIETPLLDGSTAVFEYQQNESFIAGKLYPLTFAINDPEGDPADLEPYMGMMGHAVIYRKEGGVYSHLHPVGNYSMASQEIIESRIAEASVAPSIPEANVFYDSVQQVVNEIALLSETERSDLLMAGMEHTGLGLHEDHGSTVTFPYAFPQAGEYRIWIQMKRDGKVLNSSFDAKVIL